MKINVEIEVPEGYELLNNSASSMLVDEINKVVAYGFNVVKKHDQHAELKAQYALDVEKCKLIDGLEAWQLWQEKIKINENWSSLLRNDVFRYDIFEYRRHPHADSMIAYHKCSDADKKRWQIYHVGSADWLYFKNHPQWDEKCQYRLKPRIITINGVEYNAPMNVAPEKGKRYWYFLEDFFSIGSIWDHDNVDLNRLKENRAFLNKEDCQAVCDAFKAILAGAE